MNIVRRSPRRHERSRPAKICTTRRGVGPQAEAVVEQPQDHDRRGQRRRSRRVRRSLPSAPRHIRSPPRPASHRAAEAPGPEAPAARTRPVVIQIATPPPRGVGALCPFRPPGWSTSPRRGASDADRPRTARRISAKEYRHDRESGGQDHASPPSSSHQRHRALDGPIEWLARADPDSGRSSKRPRPSSTNPIVREPDDPRSAIRRPSTGSAHPDQCDPFDPAESGTGHPKLSTVIAASIDPADAFEGGFAKRAMARAMARARTHQRQLRQAWADHFNSGIPGRRPEPVRRSAALDSRALRVAASIFGQNRLARPVAADTLCAGGVGPPLHLHRPVLQATLADHHAEGDADEVGVLELHAGTPLAVVHEHVHAGGSPGAWPAPRPPPSRPRSSAGGGRSGPHTGASGERPDDPVGVVAGLHRGGHDAVHADPVAAHDDGVGLVPSWSRNVAPIADEYLVPSLKTWPTSMPCASISGVAAPRARVAGGGVAEVADVLHREVSARDDARSGGHRRRWPPTTTCGAGRPPIDRRSTAP